MRREPVVAIAGATGLVGNEMLTILETSKMEVKEVKLLASKDSAGEVYKFREDDVRVEELEEGSFEGVDIALFALGAELAEKFVPIAVDSGAVAIDNSSRYRLDKEVPLIVPEVNGDLLSSMPRLIANPNCSTIQLCVVLDVIEKAAGIERVVVSTYQSVSGAGKAALDELWSQTLGIFQQKEISPEVFQHEIAFNCIPQIDVITESGYTKEETKIVHESRKILRLPSLRITATAVRVPVFHSHAESVNVETKKPLSPESLIELLQSSTGVEVYSSHADYPMQRQVTATDTVHVGRIRKDESVANGLDIWIVADNVRKGAALNAIQIAEDVARRYTVN